MTQAQKLADLSQAFTAGSLGFRNLLLNAEGRINQRAYGNGAATASANQYTLDRWRVIVAGQALGIGSGIGSARQLTAPAGGVEQVIESVNVTGGVYCLNWIGSATATVNGVAVPPGGSFTLPAETNATVRFIGGTFTQPQLEIGAVPTTFDYRPYWLEMLACQRYFETGPQPFLYIAGLANITYAYGDLRYLVQKRAPATIVFSGWQYFNGGAGAAFTPSLNYNTVDKFSFMAQSIANWNGWYGSGSWTASAEL